MPSSPWPRSSHSARSSGLWRRTTTSTASTSWHPHRSPPPCWSPPPSWRARPSTDGRSRLCWSPASSWCSTPSSARQLPGPSACASTATGGSRRRRNGDRRPPSHRHGDRRRLRAGRGAQPRPVVPGRGVRLLRRVARRRVHRAAGARCLALGDRGRRHGISPDDGAHARQGSRPIALTSRGRLWLFAVPALVVAGLLVWSFTGLPSFGHYRGPYGNVINASAVPQRHVTNAVAAVNFDYRGFDTIGEEFILFTSVIGVSALLRLQRRERELTLPPDPDPRHRAPETADSVTVICMGLVAPLVLLGLYIVVHGHLTPGVGFQGGGFRDRSWLVE